MTITTNGAPGVYTNIVTAPPSPNGDVITGTWFVTGLSQAGAVGVAIPITSMNDYANYLGARTTDAALLYDSLDEFFHDGGNLAYVSRIVGPAAASAAVTLKDQASPTAQNTLVITAAGAGSWGNNLTAVVSTGSVSGSYILAIENNGTVAITSPNLFYPADAVTWFAQQPEYQALVTITNAGSTTASPNNNPANGSFALTGGSDDDADVSETQWTNALTVFNANLGNGQVSAPGHTTALGYVALLEHAQTYNRVALCDVADNSVASSLVAQANGVKAAAPDSSYGAMFAPWIIIPGVQSTNPSATSPVSTRTVPPSALAAALMAANDQTNDANRPAAGPNGTSTYAIGVTETYNQANLGLLNSNGVDIVRNLASGITVYGYRSLAVDPNWVYLNNVRFRMQVVETFDAIGEDFIFNEIDGQGHLISRFNSALSAQCLAWYQNGSLFGATPTSSFVVNTGPQVNTNTTIAAGQLNAQVSLKMSTFGEFVFISVTKYLITTPFAV
jgi:hypothetical protein